MGAFDFGPVEFYLVSLAEERVAESLTAAIDDLVADGTIRLLDLLVVSRAADGTTVTSTEIDAAALVSPGLIGDEDVLELIDTLEPGRSGAIVAFELTWARRLAGALAAAGGEVVRVDRIPAPVVNALFDEFEDAE